MVVQFRIKGFSTSPVMFRYQSGEVGPGSVAAAAVVFVGEPEAHKRLMMNTAVIIAANPAEVFFILPPTGLAYNRNMTRVIFKNVAGSCTFAKSN